MSGIIFDFWGTVVENGIYPSPIRQVQYILRVNMEFHDFVTRFESSFMTQDSENLTTAFQKACKDLDVRPPEFVVDKLIGMWNKNTILAKPFPETIEVLRSLREKGHKLALVADTDPFSVESVVKKFELDQYFDVVLLSYKEKMLKTDPKMLESAVEKLGMKKEDCILVGDSMESDMKSAENAGIKSVLVDRRQKREYIRKVATLSELEQFLG
jgi:putative hydrolase of the HAD superfamily